MDAVVTVYPLWSDSSMKLDFVKNTSVELLEWLRGVYSAVFAIAVRKKVTESLEV